MTTEVLVLLEHVGVVVDRRVQQGAGRDVLADQAAVRQAAVLDVVAVAGAAGRRHAGHCRLGRRGMRPLAGKVTQRGARLAADAHHAASSAVVERLVVGCSRR